MDLDKVAEEITGKKEEEKPTPSPKEYVKINGVWQHTQVAWYIDKDKLNFPKKTQGSILEICIEDWQCVAHVHHWKTVLEEYCNVDQNWKCVRCGDIVPESIQGMIKIYRPLKSVNLQGS